MLKRIYLSWVIFVYALYLYFNKGIAYTYLAEITLVMGLVLVVTGYKKFQFPWDRRVKVLAVLLLITLVYMVKDAMRYPLMDVVRDSFMFNYAYFILVVYLFKDDFDLFKEKLYKVYKYFPFVIAVTFLLKSNITAVAEFSLFGDIPFFAYKNGDLGVHLLICTFFMMNGNIRCSKKFEVFNFVLIGYLFLIAATFNRGGMLSYMVGLSVFLFISRKKQVAQRYFMYLKYIPAVLIIALPLYLSTRVNSDDPDGRSIGIEQLTNNITSIVKPVDKGDLNSNVTWRLVWWAKIVNYTVLGEYFVAGKGLGVNLAIDDDIVQEDDALRSPHNFHLNVLARFGVPIFLFWLYWLFLVFRRIRFKSLPTENVVYIAVVIAFFVNACFDVYLEGPMGAFPCWLFVGLGFVSESLASEQKTKEAQALQNETGGSYA